MLEREIEALLKVDVPADFLPRLHARIQHAPLPSVWTFWKMYFAVTAAVGFRCGYRARHHPASQNQMGYARGTRTDFD
jgi:hypothetical protein